MSDDRLTADQIRARLTANQYTQQAYETDGDYWDGTLYELITRNTEAEHEVTGPDPVFAFVALVEKEHPDDKPTCTYDPDIFAMAFNARFAGTWATAGTWLRDHEYTQATEHGEPEEIEIKTKLFDSLADWVDWKGRAQNPDYTEGFTLMEYGGPEEARDVHVFKDAEI